MSKQITIFTLQGNQPYQVSVCDSSFSNCQQVAVINDSDIPYTFVVPSPYDLDNTVYVKIVDSIGCVITDTYSFPTPAPTRTPQPTPTMTPTPTPTINPNCDVTYYIWTPTPTPTITPTPTLNPISPRLFLDASNNSSYPGTGTTWFDLSGNNFHTALSGITTYDPLSGSSILFNTGYGEIPNYPINYYSNDFTFEIWHYYLVYGTNIMGLLWSEYGLKNLVVAYLSPVGYGGLGFRIDDSDDVYDSFYTGTTYNNFTGDTLLNVWIKSTIVKSGDTITLYWDDAIKKWEFNTNGSWTVSPTNNITIASSSYGSFNSIVKIGTIKLYDYALDESTIISQYNIEKTRFGIP